MIVCICRRISSSQIGYHQSCGARTPDDIFTAQGCQPNCGKCVDRMAEMLGAPDDAAPVEMMAAE